MTKLTPIKLRIEIVAERIQPSNLTDEAKDKLAYLIAERKVVAFEISPSACGSGTVGTRMHKAYVQPLQSSGHCMPCESRLGEPTTVLAGAGLALHTNAVFLRNARDIRKPHTQSTDPELRRTVDA